MNPLLNHHIPAISTRELCAALETLLGRQVNTSVLGL